MNAVLISVYVDSVMKKEKKREIEIYFSFFDTVINNKHQP